VLTSFGHIATAAVRGGTTGDWQTQTINRVKIFPNTGSFVAGSRATLYGVA
jgi:hypothetical protein